MINFDMNRFKSDSMRMMQLVALAAVALFALLNAFVDAKFLGFLFILSLGGLGFFSLVPAYLDSLGADTSPLSRSGRIGLRGAEAAGLAGVALVIVTVCLSLKLLIASGPGGQLAAIGYLLAIFILMAQAVVGLGIAAGVGLTNLLRNGNVEIEAPPAPQPAAQAQAYQQPYDQQQQYQQQQYQQQPQQGYQQPGYQQQYPPQGGGYDPNQGGQGQ